MKIGPSAHQAGLEGVRRGLNDLNRAANEIARNGTTQEPDAASLAESAVDLRVARNQVQASARVIETENEVLGSLLDTRA